MLVYDVILDVGTTGCQQSVCLYQGDERLKLLRITLLQNGRVYTVPQDMTAYLDAVTPDGPMQPIRCFVRSGSVYYLVGAAMTETACTIRCQARLCDGSGGVMYTPEFSVTIDASLTVPELPEGAAEEASLAMWSASELPATAADGTVVYLDGSGFYRYADETWTQLTDDATPAAVAALQLSAHTHQNSSVIGQLSEGTRGKLYYNGRPVGMETVTTLPSNVEYGQVVYKDGEGFYVNSGFSFGEPMWAQITYDTCVTDGMVLWNMKHLHENKTVLDKLTESNGSLLYDGRPSGVTVVATPLSLPANAPDGSVAAALNSGVSGTPVALPAQIADEEVEADVAGLDLRIGTPTYNASVLQAALSATQDIDDICADADFGINGALAMKILPVVADVSDNDYTDAGVAFETDGVFVSQNAAKKYAIVVEPDFELIAPEQITQVDNAHISVPNLAIYAFEDAAGLLLDAVNGTLYEGWNVIRSVVEFDGQTFGDVTDVALTHVQDINDYVILPTDDGNEMTVEGAGASQLFAGLIERTSLLPGGLYVKLGTWKRLAEGDAQEEETA